MQRDSTIDALRIVACTMVVLFHYGCMYFGKREGVLQFLWWGVPLFFTISGYVILMTAERSKGGLDFLKKRAYRLYPAFIVCSTITWITTYVVGQDNASVLDLVLNWSLLYHLLPVSVNVQAIDSVYWSLAVEVQFYLMVALVITIGQLRHVRAITAVWVLLALGFQTLPWRVSQFLSLEWAAYFGMGIALYLYKKHHSAYDGLLFLECSAVASCQVLVSSKTSNLVTEYMCMLLMHVSIVAVLAGGYRIKYSSWITVMGACTYPMYLIHNNIGTILIDSQEYYYAGVTMAVLITLTVAYTVTKFEFHIKESL